MAICKLWSFSGSVWSGSVSPAASDSVLETERDERVLLNPPPWTLGYGWRCCPHAPITPKLPREAVEGVGSRWGHSGLGRVSTGARPR